MRALADADGDVFLPNASPGKPADHIFICMEPSLGGWARSGDDAKRKVEAGFRNFHYSPEDFILHFSIRRYLCKPHETYHLTDVSKGAMFVAKAKQERMSRYDRWYGLLLEELELVATPGAMVFAVGNAVASFLEGRNFPRTFRKILHYSGVAARSRSAGVAGYKKEFESFRDSVSLGDLVSVSEKVLMDLRTPEPFRSDALRRVSRGNLSISRQQLIFNYKKAFEMPGQILRGEFP